MTITLDGTTGITTPGLTNTGTETIATLSVSGAVTLSGGTANGVGYLNGSKVLTSGTALTFDGTNLSGTGSMGTTIASKTAQFNAAGGSIYASFADGTNTWRIGGGIISAGQFNLYDLTNSQTTLGFVAGAAGYSAFYQNNAEQMRLNSTGLGIGTSSPLVKLNAQSDSITNDLGQFVISGTTSSSKRLSIGFHTTSNYGFIQALIAGDNYYSLALQANGGNVGIGTNSPGAKLSLEASSGTPLNYIDTTANTFSSTTGIRIGSSNTANASISSGLALWNNVYSVGAYSPVISFSSRSSNGTYNNAYAGIYGILGGQGADANWVTGHIAFATSSSAGLTERMRLDSSGNLGLGVTPSAWASSVKALEMPTGAFYSYASGSVSNFYNLTNAYLNSAGNPIYKQSSFASQYLQTAGQHIWYNAASGTAGNAITFTQAMTLNASNQLMIGTTAPSTFPYLTVANTGVDVQVISTTTTSALMDANATNNILALRAPFSASPATATNFGAKWGIWFSGGPPSDTTNYPYSSTQAHTTVIGKSAAIYAVSEDPGAGYNRTVGLAFYTSAFDAGMTQSARFDGRGNFAVGMTPSPWGSGRTSIQVYGSSTAAYFAGGTANCVFGNNFYHNGTNDVFTNATWYAAYYAQDYLGNHSWTSSTAASASANSAVTFSTLMTLTQAGNLLVGLTSYSTSPAQGFVVSGNSATGAFIGHASGTASGATYVGFNYNAAGIGSITQSGTTAVLYNVTSDRRLKDNITDADSASNLIDAIKVRQFDWKADGSHQRYGMIAQELHEVAPEAVHSPVDPDDMMAVDYSKLVPMLVKEIQSLRVRLNALESK